MVFSDDNDILSQFFKSLQIPYRGKIWSLCQKLWPPCWNWPGKILSPPQNFSHFPLTLFPDKVYCIKVIIHWHLVFILCFQLLSLQFLTEMGWWISARRSFRFWSPQIWFDVLSSSICGLAERLHQRVLWFRWHGWNSPSNHCQRGICKVFSFLTGLKNCATFFNSYYTYWLVLEA